MLLAPEALSYHYLRIVAVDEADSHELTAPLQYFVEVSSYTKVTGHAPTEGAVVTKRFQGQTLAGATCLHGWTPSNKLK